MEEEEEQSAIITAAECSPVDLGRCRRSMCSGCSRPSSVCLCPYLPARPMDTQTHVVIVLHPHEAHNKLSTTPLLLRCLSNSSVVVSRRLRPGLSPLLDHSPPAIYLFPSSDPSAVRLTDLLLRRDIPSHSVIVAFDATWTHAREMVKASEGYLGNFASRVFLEFDERVSGGSIFDSELLLRKEPFGGCVSTLEAVARALRVVEPNGPEIEERLIGALRGMVRLQAQYLKPTKPRPKLESMKKKKVESNDKVEDQKN